MKFWLEASESLTEMSSTEIPAAECMSDTASPYEGPLFKVPTSPLQLSHGHFLQKPRENKKHRNTIVPAPSGIEPNTKWIPPANIKRHMIEGTNAICGTITFLFMQLCLTPWINERRVQRKLTNHFYRILLSS